jgi:hypothetical protein
MGAAALGWHTVLSEEESRKETTALMTPMATGKAFENEDEGGRVRGAMQSYAVTVGVHQEQSTGQWICFRVQWDKRRATWQTAGGAIRKKTEKTMAKWIVGEGEWVMERRKGKLCANPTNFGLITWALLWQEESRKVVVGEMVEVLKMIARKAITAQLAGDQLNGAMRELVGYGPTGEWEKIEGVPSEGGERAEGGNKKKRKKVQQGIRGLMTNPREAEVSHTKATVEKGKQNDSEGTPVRGEPSRWDRQGSAFGCILYSVICLRGNGVIRRTRKVIQGDDNGHVGRPC